MPYKIKFDKQGRALRRFTVQLDCTVPLASMNTRPLTKRERKSGYTKAKGEMTWHRVVKNTAIEGWRYDAVQQRAQVD